MFREESSATARRCTASRLSLEPTTRAALASFLLLSVALHGYSASGSTDVGRAPDGAPGSTRMLSIESLRLRAGFRQASAAISACGKIAVVSAILAAGGCGGATAIEQQSGGTPGESVDTGRDGGGLADSSAAEASKPPGWKTILELGAPGWRASREPLCTEHSGSMYVDVWSDEQGVFSLVGASCNALANVPCDRVGNSLYANSGDGWRVLYTGDDLIPDPAGVSGFVGGDLIVSTGLCAINLLNRRGTFRCTLRYEDLGVPEDIGNHVYDVATSASAAYALAGTRVLEYAAPSWNVIATMEHDPILLGSIAAAGDAVVVAGYQQFVAQRDASGNFMRLEHAPAGNYTDVWIMGSNIWLSNTDGYLVRFDGESWTVIDTGMNSIYGDTIDGLWGSTDGVLYFHGQRGFGRWKDGVVEPLATLGELRRFTSIWGNSANEVFLSVFDGSARDEPCSGVSMVWFDGSEFHAF